MRAPRRSPETLGTTRSKPALVWIFLPASTVHPDSLDELQSIEAGRHAPSSKHPADMPLLG